MPEVTNDLRLPVLQAAPRRQLPAVPVVARPWLFAFWIAAASVVAAGGGLVLGLVAASEAGIGAERWTESVQAHGRLQLFGVVAPLAVALAFEFIPRLLGSQAYPATVRLLVPGALASGALLAAVGQVWNAEASFLAWPGAALLVAGSLAFVVLVWRVPLPRPASVDSQPLYLRAAAVWLALAAVLAAIASHRATAGVVDLADSRTVVETFLRGFVLLMIMGVALRAFVGHLGLRPMAPSKQFAVLAIVCASLGLWLSAQGFAGLPESEALARAGDTGHAVAILLFTAWFGVLGKLRHPSLRPRYELLLPVAWIGSVIYALWLLGAAAFSPAGELTVYEEGAIRHTFLLGFMLPLIVAMAHVVLARFGSGSIPWETALTVAFWLLILAWPMRVAPVAVDGASSTAIRTFLGIAGMLAIFAQVLVAVVAGRVAADLALAGRVPRAKQMREGVPERT